MKIIIKLILFFSGIYGLAFAQPPEQNVQKYWYYHYRLTTDFMAKGDCVGCSEIMNERAYKPNSDQTTTMSTIAKWGDQTINLGEYIAVLATEYKLLYDAGQPTDTTLQELCYALKALNRLDAKGEMLYGELTGISHTYSTDDLNGWFVRDDVPIDFLTNHPQLMQGINTGHHVDSLQSDYSQSVLNGWPIGTYTMSHDQVWHLLMGLSLVRKYLYHGLTYNNTPLNDKNGNADLYDEAADIADRIISRMKSDSWTIVNPVDDTHSSIGWQVGELSYGAAEAGCYIQNVNTTLDVGLPLHTCTHYHNTESYADAIVWNDIGHNVGLALTYSYEDYKPEILAAEGNSWWNNINPVIPDPITVIHTVFDPDVLFHPSHWVEVIIGLAPVPINETSELLAQRAAIRDNQHLPMLRKALHGGTNPLDLTFDYADLLNHAPCEGPYNFSGSGLGMAPFDWSSRDRLHESDERGGYGHSGTFGNHNGSSQGDYPGIDYMLYYNLYALTHSSSSTATYVNYMDRVITYGFPVYTLPGSPGSHSTTKAVVEGFHTIAANNTITADGDVDYRAGVSIHLQPGFHATEGCAFHAYIDPFTCGSSGDYRMANADTTGDNPTRNAVAYTGKTTFIPHPDNNASYYQDLASDAVIQNPIGSDVANTNVSIATVTNPIQATAVTTIVVQPNPNNGTFQVVFTGADKINARLTLMNIYGNTIMKQQVFNAQNLIDISGEAKGIYYLQIENGQTREVKKIIYQ